MRKFKFSLLIAIMMFATTATTAGAAEPNGRDTVFQARPIGVPHAVTMRTLERQVPLRMAPQAGDVAPVKPNAPGAICPGGYLIQYLSNFDYAWCNWTSVNGYLVLNGTYYYLTWIEDSFTGTHCGWYYWYWDGFSWIGAYWLSNGSCGF